MGSLQYNSAINQNISVSVHLTLGDDCMILDGYRWTFTHGSLADLPKAPYQIENFYYRSYVIKYHTNKVYKTKKCGCLRCKDMRGGLLASSFPCMWWLVFFCKLHSNIYSSMMTTCFAFASCPPAPMEPPPCAEATRTTSPDGDTACLVNSLLYLYISQLGMRLWQ